MSNAGEFQQAFMETLKLYKADDARTVKLWNEIHKKYTSSKRHYHNLNHLGHLLRELLPVKNNISDFGLIVLSVAYHDIIYNTFRHDNEERSARLASRRLTPFLQKPDIEKCKSQILATKAHQSSPDPDTNYFTDADLAILGSDGQEYMKYTQLIRKEYSFYPAAIYNKGRRKAILHFLEMERIFKTGWFFEKYEKKARQNLQEEITLLSNK